MIHDRFRRHDRRPVHDLSGLWDFRFLGDVDPSRTHLGSIDYDDRMPVPGCFDATPRYAGRRGLAAYRTTVWVADPSRHRLVLDGAHHWCEAFLDGQSLGRHAGGFTRFAFDVVGCAPGPAELVVLVDNRFDDRRCPLHLEYFDWYHYGGIARGASWQQLGSAWIDAVRVTTLDWRTGEIEAAIDYGCDTPGRLNLGVECGSRAKVSESIDAVVGGETVKQTFLCEQAKPWSPARPHLQTLTVRLGGDDLRLRFGLRQVRIDDGRILLNDEPVTLLGVNRHEAHPDFGCATPLAIQAADLQHVTELGGNFVRGSHYPQDQNFLDLCDETGVLVWSEAIAWQPSAEHLTDRAFLDAQKTHIDEMIAAAYNHPSVIMWGLLNEGESHRPQARSGYEELIAHVRVRDGSRPVTYACNHPHDDQCLDLADVISLNMYPGWYGGGLETIEPEIDKALESIRRAGQDHKPIMISEIGAGALSGWRDALGERWSEQYQSALLAEVIRVMFEADRQFCGLAIWQFCDCRTSTQAQKAISRPRTFNNKGLLDEYRRPKEAYETVRRLYRRLAGEAVDDGI